MRLLVLDTNIAYANPTSRYFLEALAQQTDVIFVGLNYQTEPSSVADLERRYGKFDLILGQTWMFGEPGVGEYGPYVPPDLRDHPAPKVLNLMQMDPYAIPEYIYSRCIEPSTAVINTVVNQQFRFMDPRDMPFQEEWFDPNGFMVANRDLVDAKWLMLPHCVASHEFLPAGKRVKKFDAIVPGTGYQFRKLAEKTLLDQTISFTSLEGTVQRALYWGSSYYAVQKYIDVTGWFNARFRNRIAASRMAVTCDGSIGYALRKFFEIPAFGTLLVAQFFPDAASLGFIEGENCFSVTTQELDRLAEILAFVQSDSVAATQMVAAGQDMVRENHSADVRARQFVLLAEALVRGDMPNQRWQNGKMAIS